MKLNLEFFIFFIILSNLKQSKVNSHQLENCPNVKNPEVLLSRKKRSLKFPDGSTFGVNFQMYIVILLMYIEFIDFQISQAFGQGMLVGWNLGWYQLLELDVIFKVPGFSDMLFYKHHRKRLHKRQKRELLKGIEDAISV